MMDIIFTTITDNSYRSTFVQPRVIFESYYTLKNRVKAYHNKEGPAIVWSDGFAAFHLYGRNFHSSSITNFKKSQDYKDHLMLMAYVESITDVSK